jgi:hypothetical protein
MKVPSKPTTASIHIQGAEVLKFVSINSKEVLFDIVGLVKPKIRIIDQRLEVRNKMEEVQTTKDVDQLTDLFCNPARVSFLPSKESGEIVVQLTKTRAKKPRFMLWIATGIKGEIPYYDYQTLEIQSFKKKTYALFSLYKRYPLTKD